MNRLLKLCDAVFASLPPAADGQTGVDRTEEGLRADLASEFIAWMEACWPVCELDAFNKGVVRGFEIIKAQIENGHTPLTQSPPSTPPAPTSGDEGLVELSRDECHLALWKAIEAIKLGNKTDDKLILDNLRDQGVWLHRFKGCVSHPDRAIREHLDGDDLCQECCDQWARNEGDSLSRPPANEVAPANGGGA